MRYLVHSFSPINVISGLAAVEHLAPGQRDVADIIVFQPHLKRDIQAEIGEFAQRAGRASASVGRVVSVSDDQWASVSAAAASEKAEALHKLTGHTSYGAILYAHDVVGTVVDDVAAALPGLRRICYGEGMGVAYEKDYVLSLLRGERAPPATPWERLRQAMGIGAESAASAACRPIAPRLDQAVLILPGDQTGRTLEGIPLAIVAKDRVLHLIERIRAQCPQIAAFEQQIAREARGRQVTLLMTENHAEGAFIDLDAEIAMYVEALTQHAPQAGLIVVKPHPAEQSSRADGIRKALRGTAEVVEVPDTLIRYPVELMRGLVENATCLCMSYPAVSLLYLYGIDVVQPMTRAVIEKWFPERVWASYADAVRIYDDQIAALPAWDGRSVLYRGGRRNARSRARRDPFWRPTLFPSSWKLPR